MPTEHETLTALYESQRTVDSQKRVIATQAQELQRLRAALRVFTEDPKPQDGDGDVKMAEPAAIDTQEMNVSSEDEEDNSSPTSPCGEPVWFEDEEIYRCSVCDWEIADRACEGCGRNYIDWVCEETPDSEPLKWNDIFFHHRLGDEDYRMSAPRADTPLHNVTRLQPDTIAQGYENRVDEYRSLLARGATQLMCETFYLAFNYQDGIWLEMKDDLFDEWAGPNLSAPSSDCLSWRICLGREIRLDESGADEDGSRYIEEFLEEALLFGGRTNSGLAWQTIEETPGNWITKPLSTTDAIAQPVRAATGFWGSVGLVRDGVDVSSFVKNQYESDNPGDEDEECNPSDDEDGRVQLGWNGEGGYGPDGSWSDSEKDIKYDEPESEGDSFDSDWDSQDELYESGHD